MKHLPAILRIPFLFLNLFCGLLPSFAFFVWVERNASLPLIGIQFHWPWVDLAQSSRLMRSLMDLSLFLSFGVIHSLFAQNSIHRLVKKFLPWQTIRSFYIVVTGVSLVLLMGSWQSTGVVIWALPLSLSVIYALSISLFWFFLAISGWTLRSFDFLHFVGLKQLYQSDPNSPALVGTQALCKKGLYSYARHPVYFFTLLAFLITPVMTLDRLIILAGSLLYLAFGIPLEEKKLIALFGSAYVEYQKETPALFPTQLLTKLFTSKQA